MFVNYLTATSPELPPMPACLYEYVTAANGVFVRAERPGLSALVPVTWAGAPIRGLAPLVPYVRVAARVPGRGLAEMMIEAYHQHGREILFYLKYMPRLAEWYLSRPEQVQSSGGVHPLDPYAAGADTLVELHSHHGMDAFFSRTDDRDESSGFRLFAVIGRIDTNHPSIRVRVGIYGHFWQFPASWVFELPPFARDAYEEAREIEYVEVEDAA